MGDLASAHKMANVGIQVEAELEPYRAIRLREASTLADYLLSRRHPQIAVARDLIPAIT
jgi:hypothetical protein